MSVPLTSGTLLHSELHARILGVLATQTRRFVCGAIKPDLQLDVWVFTRTVDCCFEHEY